MDTRVAMVLLVFGTLCGCQGTGMVRAPALAGVSLGAGERDTEAAPEITEGRLEEYVLLSLSNHPRLRAQYERWAAARLRVDRAAVLPNPVVTYAFFARPVHTRVGAQRHRLSLRQAFPWPGQRQAQRRGAVARAEAEGLRLQAMGLEVRRQVAGAWWELWEIREQRSWRERQLALLEGLQEVIQARLEVGRGNAAELLTLGMRLSRARDALGALEEAERSAVATLRERVGQDIPGFPTAAATESLFMPAADEAHLLEVAGEHPFLRRQAALGEAFVAEADAAAARGLPRFQVGLDWIVIDAAGTSPEAGDDAVAINVGLSVPLWGGAERRAGQAAQAQARGSRFEVEAMRLALTAEVQRSLSGLRDARRRALLVERELLPQGMAAYEAELAALAVGERGVAEALIAQGELLELGLELLRHRRRHGQSWARLEAAVGAPVNADGDEQ